MIKYYNGEMYTIPKEFEEEIRAEVKVDIAQECHYLLNSGMGKKKSLKHLIKILEKKEGVT